jgi:carbon storage regulator CsrA
MLVLSRKPGQSVVIGEDIRITVVSREGSRVTLAIEAPRDQRILRGELSETPEEPIVVEVSFADSPPTPTHACERTPL